jgi:hypothetical protein
MASALRYHLAGQEFGPRSPTRVEADDVTLLADRMPELELRASCSANLRFHRWSRLASRSPSTPCSPRTTNEAKRMKRTSKHDTAPGRLHRISGRLRRLFSSMCGCFALDNKTVGIIGLAAIAALSRVGCRVWRPRSPAFFRAGLMGMSACVLYRVRRLTETVRCWSGFRAGH